MKKNLKKIFTILLLFMMVTTLNQVKAVESGGSISGIGGSSPGSSSGEGYGGSFIVNRTMGYRVSLIEYDPVTKSNPTTIKSKTFLFKNFNKNYLKGSDTVGGTAQFQYSESRPKTENNVVWKPSETGIPVGENGDYKIDSRYDVNKYKNSSGEYKFEYKDVVNYFYGLTNPNKTSELLAYLKNTFNFSLKEDPTECQKILNYYILVEPMAVVANGYSDAVAQYYFGTATELSKMYKGSWVNTNLSKAIYTPTTKFSMSGGHDVTFSYFSDGGINNVKNGLNTSKSTIITSTNSYGVGTLWIGHLYNNCTTCYEPEIKSSGNLKCEKTNENNSFEYIEEYKEVDCTEKNKLNSQYGKFVEEKTNCTLYCLEKASSSLPGNMKNQFLSNNFSNKYTYFAWPGIHNAGSDYEMKMNSTLECTIVNKSGKTCTKAEKDAFKQKAEDLTKNFKFSAKLTGGTNKKLDKVSLFIDKNDVSITTKDVPKENYKETEDKKNDKFTTTKEVYFRIPKGMNQLYNKTTDTVEHCTNRNCNINGYDNREQGVISYSIKDEKITKHDLIISDIVLGTDNKFGNIISKSGSQYKCTYSYDYESGPPCECPPDTAKAGDDLSKYVKDGMTCAEAKALKCNEEVPDTCIGYSNDSWNAYKACYLNALKTKYNTKRTEYTLYRGITLDSSFKDVTPVDVEIQKLEIQRNSQDSKNAYNDCKGYLVKTEIDMKSCMKTKMDLYGMSEVEASNACEQNLCTNCVSSFGVVYDLRACMSTGSSYTICDSLYCPDEDCKDGICDPPGSGNPPGGGGSSGGGGGSSDPGKIIYRTIDLNNPFPGNDNGNNYIEFSNGGKGRRPGDNWNSVTYVKNKILNARGVRGYRLYTEKEPLYVITLTPSDINEIRKYNDSNDYSKFDLNCTSNNKDSKCISNFLHKDFSKIVTSGKCKNIGDSAGFDECYREDM